MCALSDTKASSRNGRPLGRALLIALIALLAGVASVSAQRGVDLLVPGEILYEIRLTDASVFFARVESVTGDAVLLVTSGGARLEVQRRQIRDVRIATGTVVKGEFWREDTNLSRLFFSATGRSLAQGEAYVGTYLLVLPFVAVGVTDRITLAVGAPVLFGTLEPFYLAPKVQLVRTDRATASIGTLVLVVDDEVLGITYGVGTFGTADKAVTAGLGFGFSGDDFERQPVAMIGGELRVSRRVKLITENYFLPGETGAVLSGGVRILGERFSTDLGIVGLAGEDGGCCLPIINFSYAFGRGR